MKTLRNFFASIIIVTAGCVFPVGITHAQETAAMVTAVEGEARVETGGVTKKLEIGMELQQGAVVNVSTGGASLVFISGELMELAEGDALTLGAGMTSSTLTSAAGTRGVTPQDGVTVAEEGVGKANTDKWQSQLAYIYGVRGDASVVPVSPRLAIASSAPVFYWFDGDSARQGADRMYSIILKDDAGNTILRTEAPGRIYSMNSFSPAAMPGQYRVEPGKRYTWTVSPKDKPSETSEASYIYIDEAGLELAAEKQNRLAELRDAESIGMQAYHTLMAMYYLDERERLFSDAIPHLLALEAVPGGAQYARTQMALLLNRFGNEVSTAAAFYAHKAR